MKSLALIVIIIEGECKENNHNVGHSSEFFSVIMVFLQINGVAIYDTVPWKVQYDTEEKLVWYIYKL